MLNEVRSLIRKVVGKRGILIGRRVDDNRLMRNRSPLPAREILIEHACTHKKRRVGQGYAILIQNLHPHDGTTGIRDAGTASEVNLIEKSDTSLDGGGQTGKLVLTYSPGKGEKHQDTEQQTPSSQNKRKESKLNADSGADHRLENGREPVPSRNHVIAIILFTFIRPVHLMQKQYVHPECGVHH